jgi:transcriptional regulator with XRE-family HTH domain
MKPNQFDLKVIEVVKSFRILAGEKQANLATLLQITQPEYCRIEKGERALTMGHLHLICSHLKISLVQLIVFAEAGFQVDSRTIPLSIVLAKFTRLLEGKETADPFTQVERELISSRLKKSNDSARLSRLSESSLLPH